MKNVSLALLVGLGSLNACGDEGEPALTKAALTAVCVDDVTLLTDDDWLCGEPLVVECNAYDGTVVTTVYVGPGEVAVCAEADLVVSDEGPFFVGDTTIVVTDAELDVCVSVLTVIDTTPPRVTPRVHELWPPNHKMRRVVPEDCVDVVDACDPDVDVWFTGTAVSNEPVDGLGDGDTEVDIGVVNPDFVELRAERSGTGNGRVYTLGWRAEDAAGNALEGTCDVVVPHDQGGGND